MSNLVNGVTFRFSNVLLSTPITQIRCLAVTGRHSKNVADKKNKLDAAKNKIYSRISIKILMAAKRGGLDPSVNVDLARALKEAHSSSLPKDNIDRVLKKASDKTNTEDYVVGKYEIFGFGGVGLIVQSLTNNTNTDMNRATNHIKALAKKSDVKMASSGSVLFQFEAKGLLETKVKYDELTILEAALEAGVDDVDFYAHNLSVSGTGGDAARERWPLIVTHVEAVGLLQDALTKRGLEVTGTLGFLPKELVAVSEEDCEKNLALVEAFEELDDVDVVYHNMQL